MVLVIGEDPHELLRRKSHVPFLIDVSHYPYMDYNSRIEASEAAIEILSEHEHYEKCADLVEYIKFLKDEVKRLSGENS
ncbi:MAG: hypothetical protein ACO372_03575 [Methylophilaceae bacterium]